MTAAVTTDTDVKIIDCDTHIIEPYDLWTSRVSPKYRDQVPRVRWDESKQQDVWYMPDRPLMAAAAGAAMAGWRQYPPNRPPRMADADPATYDVAERLKRMDDYGIWAQVLYPNIAGFGGGLYATMPDANLRLEATRAYNDWLVEYTGVAPERFVMNCSVPFWDVPEAVEEIRRCHALGHRGILFSSHPNKFGQPYIADIHWDPIWEVCAELEMPVNFHIGGSGVEDFGVNYEGNGASVNYAISSSLMFMSNANALVDTIFSGICDRYPTLKFVSVESGVGWVPFQLEAMDWQWQATGLHEQLPKRLLPSEYFKRQFYTTFWFERGTLASSIEQLGADRILFETDFPHPTSMSPGPASPAIRPDTYIHEAMGFLPADVRRKILHDNAAELYKVG
ncbi:amidohydrolase [Nocardia sp. BSTN01]|uniref:amidohydrolase family protein n=1 Tax=Nocardia sp. BSTN01 TaxID=2783665 RepID=UPI00188E514D|nr:amidohydrolase family protein [Nocardia sp. BSTN01]MBF4999663.1 amidohydrolase [Nocardia sp. BSTN01]